MTSKQFQIQGYKLSMGHSMTLGRQYEFRRVISCNGADGYRLLFYFQADGEPLYPPFTNLSAKFGRVFLPVSEYGDFVDTLRNEKPLYAYINDSKPGWNHLRSTTEPVGETED